MTIAELEALLRNKELLIEKQQSYLNYYAEAMRDQNVAGSYRGRNYITLSRKQHLDTEMGVMVTNLDEMCSYHVHNWIELSYAFKGKCRMTVKDEAIILEEGQFILLDTGVPHAEGSAGEGGIFVNLIFDKTYFDHHFFSQLTRDSSVTRFFVNALNEETNHENYIVFMSHGNERLPKLMRMMLSEYYDPSLCAEDIMHSCMIMILCELVKCYEEKAVNERSSSESLRIARILRYIENNAAGCTLNQAAEEFSISPNYLTMQLKKHTGKSFKQLVQESRISYAARLLRDTDHPIRDVAERVGYENIGHFNKLFREKYCLLPGEYRKANR